jgi:hypothetical protein
VRVDPFAVLFAPLPAVILDEHALRLRGRRSVRTTRPIHPIAPHFVGAADLCDLLSGGLQRAAARARAHRRRRCSRLSHASGDQLPLEFGLDSVAAGDASVPGALMGGRGK